MTQSKNQNILYTLYAYAISNFFPISGFKWMDPEEVNLNKHTSNSSKECLLKVYLEYRKEVCNLHNDYPLAPDEIEI